MGFWGQEVGCCFPAGTVRKDFNETRVELFGNALQHVSSPKCASLPLLAPLTLQLPSALYYSLIFVCTCTLQEGRVRVEPPPALENIVPETALALTSPFPGRKHLPVSEAAVLSAHGTGLAQQ